jgi:hypothetical protein
LLFDSLLVEILQYCYTPWPPGSGESLGKIDGSRDCCSGSTQSEYGASYNKHSNVLGGTLNDDAGNSDCGTNKDGRPPAQSVGTDTCNRKSQYTSNVDRGGIQTLGCRSQVEVFGVYGQCTELSVSITGCAFRRLTSNR